MKNCRLRIVDCGIENADCNRRMGFYSAINPKSRGGGQSRLRRDKVRIYHADGVDLPCRGWVRNPKLVERG